MWIKLLESALIFLFSHWFCPLPLPFCLASLSPDGRVDGALLLYWHPPPLHPTPHFTGCSSLTPASWFGFSPGPVLNLECVFSLLVCHTYADPTPPALKCLFVWLLEQCCLKDSVFYPCDCDINVSICLVQTWTPTHPKQKHKGPPLVLHNIYSLSFSFSFFLILVFKLFICFCFVCLFDHSFVKQF